MTIIIQIESKSRVFKGWSEVVTHSNKATAVRMANKILRGADIDQSEVKKSTKAGIEYWVIPDTDSYTKRGFFGEQKIQNYFFDED